MPIITSITTEIVKAIAGKASEKAFDLATSTNRKFDIRKAVQDLPVLFEIHLIELINWSFEIPFIGLSTPQKVDSSTIELSISSAISKYDSKFDDNLGLVSENDLLSGKNNIILLGQPGAGKTTTIKRIILNYFTDGYKNCDYDVPILLRFRNLKNDIPLSLSVLDLFGIPYYSKSVDIEEYRKVKKRKNSNDDSGSKNSDESEIIGITKIVTKKVTIFVGDNPIDIFLPRFLNEIRAVLILDGLDEAPQSLQKGYLEEIESLGLKLNSGKIILTIRKSKLSNLETSFTKYEIKSLDDERIKAVAKKWIADGEGFYNTLKSKPYSDLGSRPIFLTLLLILYSKYNELPLQPYEVYRESTLLIVKDWDDHRGIIRKSSYTDFNPRKKLKFLFELSFYLTYRIKSKIFSRQMVKEIYNKIHSKYNLPSEESEDVISEIESHNGIISEAGYQTYEFSHLSIQEYLCAEYLVTLPFSQDTVSYFYEYPEPLAIAISLSGEPSLWFANLILNKSFYKHALSFHSDVDAHRNSLSTLLSRLLLESPSFSISMELGITALYLIFEYFSDSYFSQLVVNLIKLDNVIKSINIALALFEIEDINDDCIYLKRNVPIDISYTLNPPFKGSLHLSLFDINYNLNYSIESNNRIVLN